MPVEHKIETSYKTKEGTGKKTVTIIQGDVGVHAEVSIPAGQTVQINLNLDVSEIKGLNIGCSKGDCTVKTNSYAPISHCAPPIPLPSSGRATPCASLVGPVVPASIATLVLATCKSVADTYCGFAEIVPAPSVTL